jgi:phosphoglycolate phosphatase-like HAD superfamily hydrolase
VRLAGAIFDLDGTLADTLPACYAAFRAACEGLGGPGYTNEQIRALFGPSEEGMLQRAMPERWQEGLVILLEEYRRHLTVCSGLFPSIATALALLRHRGIPLALVTGKGPSTTKMSLTHFGLDGVFDAVEVGSPQGVVKAAAIGRVIARWGVAAADVIYVGDAVADMEAAREAGVRPIGAAWAPSAIAAELAAKKPHALFSSADDFHAWLVTVLGP